MSRPIDVDETRLEGQRAILRELNMLHELFPKATNLTYRGPADFLLQRGRFFEIRPDLVWSFAVPRYCYANAYRFVKESDGTLEYAEGYALSRLGTVHEHATKDLSSTIA